MAVCKKDLIYAARLDRTVCQNDTLLLEEGGLSRARDGLNQYNDRGCTYVDHG